MSEAAHVAEIWSELTEQAAGADLWDDPVVLGDVLALAGHSDATLRDGGLAVRRRTSPRAWTLPLTPWRQAVTDLAEVRARRPFPSSWSHDDYLAHASLLLRERWNDRVLRDVFPGIRRPKRRPVGEVPGLEEVDPGVVELQAALLLASTAHGREFSANARGQVFTGYRQGYQREQDRKHVSGLSVLLDQAALSILDHRRGHVPQGGRFLVDSHGNVECAHCRQAYARWGTTRLVTSDTRCSR